MQKKMLNKKYPASILVVTIMILGIVLVTALSIATVSVKERNAAIGSSHSNKAYQNADSGIEIVMDKLVKNQDRAISDLVGGSTGLSCGIADTHAVITGSTGYAVELKKADESLPTNCTTLASEIANIKSIGTDGNTQRAIGAPVINACGTADISDLTVPTIKYNEVLGADGKCWLDRNLGATQKATAFNDTAAYGWLYQWGRLTDGHQITTSGTTTILSSSNTPGHANFITISASPYDWRSPQNNALWQGVSGTNNPCPTGFRLPTKSEWATLVTAAGITNYTTAFNSSLKLTTGGYRHTGGTFSGQGSNGFYWSSDLNTTFAHNLWFTLTSVKPDSYNFRAYGIAVRCVKN